MAALIAPVLGPTLGGWITDNYSWRWIFYINAPAGALSLILNGLLVEDPGYLKAARAEIFRRGLRIDSVGIGLFALGLGCLEVVLDKGQSRPPRTRPNSGTSARGRPRHVADSDCRSPTPTGACASSSGCSRSSPTARLPTRSGGACSSLTGSRASRSMTHASLRSCRRTGSSTSSRSTRETRGDGEVHLITNVETTLAVTADVEQTAPIHTALAAKGLLPGDHLLDAEYVDVELLVGSQSEHGVRLIGPVRPDVSWQAQAGQGFDVSHFAID